MIKLLIILPMVLSCGFVKKKASAKAVKAPVIKNGSKELKLAQDLYTQGYYGRSIEELNRIESKYRSTSLESELHFSRGKAYLKMQNLEEAEKSFRASYLLWSRSSAGRAKSLYYLSSVYEQQSRDDKMIGALIELNLLPRSLNERVYLLDIPAKLSSAYSREGNLPEAKVYSANVERYLKMHVPNSNLPKESLNLVAKSLYEISENSLLGNKKRNFEEQVSSIKYTQQYLLRTIELGVSPWAEKALYRYETVYRGVLDKALKGWTSLYYRKNKLSARRDQKRKLRQLERISKLLLSLESIMLPKDSVKTKVYQRMHLANLSYKKEIEIYYLEPEVGQGLTDAAKKLLGVEPKLRNIKPKQTLRRFKKQIDMPIMDPNL